MRVRRPLRRRQPPRPRRPTRPALPTWPAEPRWCRRLASQMTVSGEDLNARPVTQPGEILEAAPGLAVVEHADGGKANQYYLRGWNLDHGTDLATFWDDVPINLPTHAHGQGYTDLNWLIPETISGLEVRKGPYFADVGDFDNAGKLHISLRDSVDQNIQSITTGSFGYERFLRSARPSSATARCSMPANSIPITVRGPRPTTCASSAALLRYSQGTATDGFSATGDGLHQHLELHRSGRAARHHDGADRPFRRARSRPTAATPAASAVRPDWRNPTTTACGRPTPTSSNTRWTCSTITPGTPRSGQRRSVPSARRPRLRAAAAPRAPSRHVVQPADRDRVRRANPLRRHHTRAEQYGQRQFLSNTLFDHVDEGNVGIYAQNTMHWTDWLRTTTRLARRLFRRIGEFDAAAGELGKFQDAAIGSPKFTAVFGPFYKTELFVGAGMGYHSNDARSTVDHRSPRRSDDAGRCPPLLVRSRGAEIGAADQGHPGLDSSVSLFYLHQDSELFFDGDTGDHRPGLPSQRTGIEITNDYRPASWLHVDADMALSRARFLGFDTAQEALYQSLAGYPQAQIGNAPGNFVYNAPWMVASAGITLARRPAGSVRCAGATSVRGRSPRTAFFSRRRSTRSMARWAIVSTTAGAFSLTRSIC